MIPEPNPKCPICNEFILYSHNYSPNSCLLFPKPFLDENGRQHLHSEVLYYKIYCCKNNHYYQKQVYKQNCWCGWEQKFIDEYVPVESTKHEMVRLNFEFKGMK